ncbi:MAG: TonB-dependent receptor [Pseudomonadota bacterium]
MRVSRPAAAFTASLLAASCAAALNAGALAQDREADRASEDVITIIAGRAPGADIAARPVTVLEREALQRGGLDDLGDALAFQPAIIGSEFNEDSGTQNDTSGTSSVNLRGLGLGATLVLLNGQRQTQASVAADDGASFVDLNALIPGIAIERVEVLKDGASPIHGSDAVAGVINVVTRDRFDGFEAEVEWRAPTEYDGSGAGYEASLIAGGERAGVHLVAAFSYLTAEGLEGFETEFTPGTGLSALGQPGAYYVVAPGGGFEVTTPSGGPQGIIDRDCAAAGGRPLVLGSDTAFGTPGFCRLDFGQFFSIVPEEERLQGFLAASGEIGATRFTLRAAGSDQLLERGNSPSLPNLQFPTIPASHPGNYFGRDVVWLGRPVGEAGGAARRSFDHDTWRIDAHLERDLVFAGRDWTASAALSFSRNRLEATITDTLADNFNLALAGFGGETCTGATPGDTAAGCFFFNPFGSGQLVTDPSDARFNAPEVIDFIIGENTRRSRADLTVFEAGLTTPTLFSLPAGDVSAAFGIQTRRETLRVDHGEAFNADAFLFIVGAPDYSGARDARAVFADAVIPVTERLQLQAALRHEDLDGFSSTDPKLSAVYRTNSPLVLRASYSRAFRAPSLHQQVSATTTLQSLTIGAQSLFRPVRTVGDLTLDPETADVFTAGAVWEGRLVRASLDLWRIEYEDLIVEENAQAIIAADLADGMIDDPRIDVSPAGDVTLVRARFVNAPRVEAQGLDLSMEAGPFSLGRYGALNLTAASAYVDEFTLVDPVLNQEVSAEGQRNFTNFARSLPQWRANAEARWDHGPVFASLGVRHTSSYNDDENGGADVDAWTVFDLQAGLQLAPARLSIGALNLFNEDPPFVATPLGYDTKVHDPRGRVVYARLSFRY